VLFHVPGKAETTPIEPDAGNAAVGNYKIFLTLKFFFVNQVREKFKRFLFLFI
jgi:hypothetical protein